MSPDKKKLAELTKVLATPIDFAALEAKGVLKKEGAWYRILGKLPEHASRKIYHLAQDKKGVKVKFDKAEKYETLARKFAELAGED